MKQLKFQTKEVSDALRDIYYKLSQSGSFLGTDKLYRVLKSKGINNIGKHTIRRWLESQDNYSLQKPVRRKFRRARVVVSGLDNQWDMDLADMTSISKFNGGIKFLLVVIDIFSRFLWIEPLKNKTGKEVVNALRRIIRKGRKCTKIRSDKGGEMINKHMKEFLQKENIYHFFTQNSDTKANYSERVIKTIKTMLYRYFIKHRTRKYVNILQKLVQTYNETPHRSLNNIAPKNVNSKNEADVWAKMYLKPSKGKKKILFHFNIGDFVRISHTNAQFQRSYYEQYSKEIFKIKTRFRMQGIPMYKIKDFLDKDIKGNFYESELLKVFKDENELWIIEKKIRKRKRNGEIEWWVRFEGFSDAFNQWIKAKDIKDLSTSQK